MGSGFESRGVHHKNPVFIGYVPWRRGFVVPAIPAKKYLRIFFRSDRLKCWGQELQAGPGPSPRLLPRGRLKTSHPGPSSSLNNTEEEAAARFGRGACVAKSVGSRWPDRSSQQPPSVTEGAGARNRHGILKGEGSQRLCHLFRPAQRSLRGGIPVRAAHPRRRGCPSPFGSSLRATDGLSSYRRAPPSPESPGGLCGAPSWPAEKYARRSRFPAPCRSTSVRRRGPGVPLTRFGPSPGGRLARPVMSAAVTGFLAQFLVWACRPGPSSMSSCFRGVQFPVQARCAQDGAEYFRNAAI